MIISVHIPRTAGSNFRTFLLDHFKDKLYLDYQDPILVSGFLRDSYTRARKLMLQFDKEELNKYDCIHGHFLPVKYGKLFDHTEAKYVIWLRDPVDRLVSHYYFLKSEVAEKKKQSPFQNKVITEDWSLEAFCFNKTIKNLVSKMLKKFPIENFEFIGTTHTYNEDIVRFSKKYFQIKKPYIRKAVNKNNMFTSYEAIDDSFRQKVTAFHQKDFELYKRALQLREQQILSID